jgi:hypothetical protein
LRGERRFLDEAAGEKSIVNRLDVPRQDQVLAESVDPDAAEERGGLPRFGFVDVADRDDGRAGDRGHEPANMLLADHPNADHAKFTGTEFSLPASVPDRQCSPLSQIRCAGQLAIRRAHEHRAADRSAATLCPGAFSRSALVRSLAQDACR